MKLKKLFYKIAIRLVVLCGLKYWATKKHVKKVSVAEMRMLRWMSENTLRHRISAS